jgi:hypothetical protein
MQPIKDFDPDSIEVETGQPCLVFAFTDIEPSYDDDDPNYGEEDRVMAPQDLNDMACFSDRLHFQMKQSLKGKMPIDEYNELLRRLSMVVSDMDTDAQSAAALAHWRLSALEAEISKAVEEVGS